MGQEHAKQVGRGARSNPKNRFEPLEFVVDEDAEPGEPRRLKTRFYDDASESVITYNSSPDIPFDASLNPYRGCEHGCAYCYARPTHEYLGFSAGLDFESKILVKRRAPELLKKELSAAKWKAAVGGDERRHGSVSTGGEAAGFDACLLGGLAGFSEPGWNGDQESLGGAGR